MCIYSQIAAESELLRKKSILVLPLNYYCVWLERLTWIWIGTVTAEMTAMSNKRFFLLVRYTYLLGNRFFCNGDPWLLESLWTCIVWWITQKHRSGCQTNSNSGCNSGTRTAECCSDSRLIPTSQALCWGSWHAKVHTQHYSLCINKLPSVICQHKFGNISPQRALFLERVPDN